MAYRQFVVFRLDNEKFGIDINSIQEITHYREATKVPNASSFVEGIINLRGKVIPVIDLKKKFEMGSVNMQDQNCRIIIADVQEKQVGLIVDDASQVIRIEEENIDQNNEILTGVKMQCVSGIAKTGESFILILDSNELI